MCFTSGGLCSNSERDSLNIFNQWRICPLNPVPENTRLLLGKAGISLEPNDLNFSADFANNVLLLQFPYQLKTEI